MRDCLSARICVCVIVQDNHGTIITQPHHIMFSLYLITESDIAHLYMYTDFKITSNKGNVIILAWLVYILPMQANSSKYCFPHFM